MSDKLGPFELNRVHCIDCLEALPMLPDGCVDVIIADIPYEFGRFDSDTKSGYERLAQSFQEWPRILAPKGAAFVFCSTAQPLAVGAAVPLNFRRMLWMYKPADCTYPLEGWLLTSEAIMWFSQNGTSNFAERRPFAHDCYYHTRVGKEGVEGHPTVKPLWVVKDLASRCPENGILLDPCIGSGTTGVAAIQLGRKFLGFEIDPGYTEIANKRIEAAQKGITVKELKQGQGTLFI
ncbi:site-specific DNA-methyltransferase [Candidatus Parcubacteria bacterium]|nr:MAG: site-specific DNA-methyltransferase [Candidatus Parcubacteria bacterium]